LPAEVKTRRFPPPWEFHEATESFYIRDVEKWTRDGKKWTAFDGRLQI
jgi:hypothetical protein